MYIYLSNLKAPQLKEKDCPHLFTLRPQLDQVFTFTDLNGHIRPAKIYKIDKKTKLIDLTWLSEAEDLKPPREKIQIQAIPEKLYLEKLFEILPHAQVSTLYLYHSHRSLKQNLNLERLHKILIRGCEQSQNAFLPEIKLIPSQEDLHRLLVSKTPLILAPSPSISTYTKDTVPADKAILVGPEGGFSDFELDFFASLNLPHFDLGPVVYPSWLSGFCYFQQTN